MQDLVPETNVAEELFGADTSDGIFDPIDIVAFPNEAIARGIQEGPFPVEPIDLSDRDYDTLLKLYESYCDFFNNQIGGAFQRRAFEGYDIRTVLYFFQFLSVYNYADEGQKAEVRRAAAAFFGPQSRAYEKGYIVIEAQFLAFQVGTPSWLSTLSIEELLDYYAELNELDELFSHAEKGVGAVNWIIEKGGEYFKLAGSTVGRVVGWVGRRLPVVGDILDWSDWLSDQQREAVRQEIKQRMSADNDDFLNYEWVQNYLRNKYDAELPI